jgi:hypothetical protein
MPNQSPPELEAKILQMTEQYRPYICIRVSLQLKLVSVGVSPGGRALPLEAARTGGSLAAHALAGAQDRRARRRADRRVIVAAAQSTHR